MVLKSELEHHKVLVAQYASDAERNEKKAYEKQMVLSTDNDSLKERIMELQDQRDAEQKQAFEEITLLKVHGCWGLCRTCGLIFIPACCDAVCCAVLCGDVCDFFLLCAVVLCFAVLCCAVLCCAVLWCML